MTTIGILLKKQLKSHHFLLVIFVILYLLFALFTYKQYGITSDEQLDYQNGKLLLEYFSDEVSPSKIINDLIKMDEKSQLISAPLFSPYGRLYLVILNLLNSKGYYEWFHLLNLLFALPLFAAIYSAIYSQVKNQFFSILGPLFLVLTPSFFGHIPANAKDIPFAIFYYLSTLAIFFFIKKEQSSLSILALGILFGITQSLRIVGIGIYIVYFLHCFLTLRVKPNIKFLTDSLLILVTSLFTMVVQWPFLGMNFFQNFRSILMNAGYFYLWDKKILFMGEFLSRSDRPLHYLPMWLLVTTPIFLIVLFFVPFLKKLFSNRFLLYLYMTLLINVIIYIIINPIVYNGIRHFLYFLPIVVTIAAISFYEIYKLLCCKNVKLLFFLTFSLGIVPVILSVLSLFPYHYVYFNELVGGTSQAYKKFDLDYWGASYTEAGIWVRENLNLLKSANAYKLIRVYACNNCFAVDYISHKKFLTTIYRETSDYIICDITSDMYRRYSGQIIHTLSKNNTPFILIRKNDFKSL